MRVLLALSNVELARSVEHFLEIEGFLIYKTDSGEEVISILHHSANEFDVVLLDSVLNDMTGLSLIKRLRSMNITKPILVVSRDSKVETIVTALNSGADDYITTPFHRDELLARILVAIRRSNGHAKSTICVGNLSLCLTNRSVQVNGKSLRLTPMEYKMLELLSLRMGRVIHQNSFLDSMYGDQPQEPDMKIISVYICKIRKKIRAANNGECPVKTVRGYGYMIEDAA